MAYCFGGGMGFVMAAFMSAMEMRDIDLGKSRRSTRHVLKKDLRRIIGTSKGFAIFGGIILFY
jgi:import inner membrane translocase subunit TIM22